MLRRQKESCITLDQKIAFPQFRYSDNINNNNNYNNNKKKLNQQKHMDRFHTLKHVREVNIDEIHIKVVSNSLLSNFRSSCKLHGIHLQGIPIRNTTNNHVCKVRYHAFSNTSFSKKNSQFVLNNLKTTIRQHFLTSRFQHQA